MKSKITLLTASLTMLIFGSPNAKAECTTEEGNNNAKCYLNASSGEFECIPRGFSIDCVFEC
jgi:hypothetical protein